MELVGTAIDELLIINEEDSYVGKMVEVLSIMTVLTGSAELEEIGVIKTVVEIGIRDVVVDR